MWSISKALQIPLDKNVKYLSDIPNTLSFVIRKRIQIDGFNELPKEKRPPELMIWDGSSKDIDDWLDRVFKRNQKPSDEKISVPIDDIEE
jgi:hypothetical protein